jgi:uncharacterized membrane protein YraQ (UPF0718 family)
LFGSSLEADPDATGEPGRRRAARWLDRLRSVELLAAVVAVAILLRGPLVDLVDGPQASAFVTVFVSVVVAGLPFVVLGSLVVAAIAAFVPPPLVSGPPGLAGLDRLLAPATEESRRGAVLAAVTFLLLSPAANPVVIAATAVAFPGRPLMVLARIVAGLVTAAAMAGLWRLLARRVAPPPAPEPDDAGVERGWPMFWERSRSEVIRAGGVLVLGALAVAVLTAWLPPGWLAAVAGSGLFAIVALALLAVLLSMRAGPDAFVAAALSPFPATAQLALLVVGPVVNLRLFSRQVAWPGPRFAVRFAPTTLLVGLLVALLLGWVVF